MKRVIRSRDEKYIGGLCGAIANVFGVDPVLVRIGFVFVTLLSGVLPGITAYVFGWLITPTRVSPAPLARLFKKPEKAIPVADMADRAKT